MTLQRRTFIAGLGAAAAWPLTARGQQRLPVAGFLGNESPEVWADLMTAFHSGLSEAGYVEGRNVAIEYRWAEGKNDRLPELVADLVRRRVAVIAAPSTPSLLAAKTATATIPIVFSIGSDPVKDGLVASFNRPAGNLTGVATLAIEMGPKRLELLHELLPAATTIALLLNPGNSDSEVLLTNTQAAAGTLGLQVQVLHASTERDLDTAFATLPRLRVGALVIGGDSFFVARSEQLAALSVRYAIPAIFQYRRFAAAGGLLSYGGSLTDSYRQVGVYTGRILRGEKPAELPVIQGTKAELIINLKTAKALGITFPTALLVRADEVIE